jgi:hypothetical protein
MKSIREFFQRHQQKLSNNTSQLIFLFLISLISHGLFIPWMGLYGDDWSLLWLSYRTGSASMFFLDNRFLFPYIYSFFSSFLDPSIWQWHILFFLIRFFSVVNLWILLRTLWPNKKQVRIWVSLLFALYPGSLIIYQPITFWTVYLQFSILLISLWTMLAALNTKKNIRWLYFFLSICTTYLNLVLLEYLYFLELLRIPILITYLYNKKLGLKELIKKTFLIGLPYLVVFAAVSLNRARYHTVATSYYNVDLGNYLSNPIETIQFFTRHMIADGFRSGILAWVQPLVSPELYRYSGQKSILVLAFIASVTALLIYLFSYIGFRKNVPRKEGVSAVFLGAVGLILAGVPFWIGNLPIEIGAANYSRFSIPAALGSAFLLYGTATLLFKKRLLSNLMLSVLCGCAVMLNLLAGNFFRNEWELQNRFFWQLAWRMPAVDPGTTFFSNELPFWTIGENSISAALNWIYMDDNLPIDHIGHYFYYDEKRFMDVFPQEKGIDFTSNHLVGTFSGNSSDVITFWYQPPACLHIINTTWDQYNPDIPAYLRGMAEKYPNNYIQLKGNSEATLRNDPIFSDEDRNTFCYFYQKTSLAAENANWDEVVELWDTIPSEIKTTRSTSELFPFIQGLAHKNRYIEAFSLSQEILELSKAYEPMVCEFWKELRQDKTLDRGLIEAFIKQNLGCDY